MRRSLAASFLAVAALVLVGAPARAENSRALLIGISQYSDPEINDLAYADEDVKTFASILNNFAGYPASDMTLLINEEATKQKISAALLQIVKDSQKNPLDHFILMYAGHGLPPSIDSKKTNAFLAPHDAYVSQFFPEGDGSELGNETFINKAWLIKQLSSMNAKNVVIILDSCYSGAKDFGQLYAENLGFKTEVVAHGAGKRDIMVVGKPGGAAPERRIAFLSSSREDQPSAEYPELRHGALSYTMFAYLDAIRKQTDTGDLDSVTVGGMYSGISNLFDTVQVKGAALSAVHQPVLFTIPEYDAVKDMQVVSIRGIKLPPPKAEPAVAAVKPPEKAAGTVYLDTGQEDCDVFIDGTKTGRTSNADFELPEGKHLVSLYLAATNYNHTVTVDVKGGEKERVEVSLRGKLSVESRPAKWGGDAPELEVYLDGAPVGRTSLSLKNVVAGTHTLRVVADQVSKERQIEIRPDSPLLVRYKIVRAPAPPREKDESGAGDVTF